MLHLFLLGIKSTITTQPLDDDDATMQRHKNNLTMQYACGTNQRVRAYALNSTCRAMALKFNVWSINS